MLSGFSICCLALKYAVWIKKLWAAQFSRAPYQRALLATATSYQPRQPENDFNFPRATIVILLYFTESYLPDPQDRSSSDFVHHSVSHPPFPSTYCTCATAAASHLPADIANINHLELHFIRCASSYGWSHLDGFQVCFQLWLVTPRRFFWCASSFQLQLVLIVVIQLSDTNLFIVLIIQLQLVLIVVIQLSDTNLFIVLIMC